MSGIANTIARCGHLVKRAALQDQRPCPWSATRLSGLSARSIPALGKRLGAHRIGSKRFTTCKREADGRLWRGQESNRERRAQVANPHPAIQNGLRPARRRSMVAVPASLSRAWNQSPRHVQDVDDAIRLLAKGLENAARRNLSFYPRKPSFAKPSKPRATTHTVRPGV